MKARDVLADRIPFWQEHNGVLGRDEAGFLEEDLLAQTPAGEGVYIAPDGTLMALGEVLGTDWIPDGCPPLYALVPIEEATDATD